MREEATALGTLMVGTDAELFSRAAELVLAGAATRSPATVGLSGGSTPQRWYRWIVEHDALDPAALARIMWLTSDERYVPLDSPESNFGNAARELLDPLGVPDALRMPWTTQVDPHSAGIVQNRRWAERFGAERCFDVCFLGMGDDGHTASIFPGSPLAGIEAPENFTSIEVPGKGWRLTITPAGLRRCERICVLVTGAGKADRLHSVFHGAVDVNEQPIQMLGAMADKVTWLVDDAAAARLQG